MAKPTSTVHIVEVDRRKKIENGINPLRIDKLRIPFVRRVDDRAQAAKLAAEKKMCRPSVSVKHAAGDEVIVMFVKEVT